MNTPEPSRRRASRIKRWLIEAAVFAAIFFAVQAWQQRDVPHGAAPGIVGTLADGRPFELDAWRKAHAGHAVALHFWADWCPICKTEEGSVSALSKDWPVMTVAMSSGSAAQVASYLSKKGLAWPALVDTDGRIAAAYGLKGVPALIVIDRQGAIRSASIGYTSEWGMRLRLWWAEHF
ncbi:MAG TPA: protein disulfide oxidoreductase [Parasulfuritortus sp.]